MTRLTRRDFAYRIGAGARIASLAGMATAVPGDACQTLSGLTLMPLGPNAATFTRAEVEAVFARTAGGRVATEVGAIAIESPVRRLSGQMFDWQEALRITTLA